MIDVVNATIDTHGTIPVRKHPYDAGMDLFCPKEVPVFPGDNATIETGVRIEIPKGYVGLIKARSSMFACGLMTDGVIDTGYTGEVIVKIWNVSGTIRKLAKGSRIAQLLIVPIATPDVRIVDFLEETERGDGGFGSTGA